MIRITPLFIGLLSLSKYTSSQTQKYKCSKKAPFKPEDIFEWANCDWTMSHPQECTEKTPKKLMKCRIVCEDVEIKPEPLKSCELKKLDLVFLVDGSGSVKTDNFELTKSFMRRVVSGLDYDENASHVSIVQFSDREELELLNSYSREVVDKTIDQMEYHDGTQTYTGAAIEFIDEVIFEHFSRSDAVQVMILLTDGIAHDAIETGIDKLENRGVVSIAVGVSGYDIEQLKKIASEESLILEASDFIELQDNSEFLTETLCSDELAKFMNRNETLVN